MDNKKQPTEKELKDIAKKVDKLVSKKKATDLVKSSGSSSNPEQEALMKAQLRQMMESMALMEKAGLVKTTGKKDMGDHKFWNTQPVPAIGKVIHHEQKRFIYFDVILLLQMKKL